MILFRKRAATYRSILKNTKDHFPSFHKLTDRKISELLSKHNIYLFEINRFLNYLARHLSSNVLSTKESIIILKRVMQKNKNTNNLAWLSVAKEILEIFIQLSIAEIPIQILSSFSISKTWDDILQLYQSYLQKLKKSNYLDLGLAVKKTIESDILDSFHYVYLDGSFLPIQPSLHKLIMRLEQLKKEITIFLPIDINRKDHPCFRAVIDVYQKYVTVDQWININNNIGKPKPNNVIQKVGEKLFSDQTIQVDDRSIEFYQFQTLEDELNYVMKSIANKIRRGINPRDIAIVSTKPMELRPMVGELAQLYKLNYPNREKPLIDLPFGKLIYSLLRIYNDERISIFKGENNYIDVEGFAELLYIKLFKESEQIIPIFEKLKAFFEDCTSFKDWYEKIDQLKQACPLVNDRFRYHPLFVITNQQLDLLEAFLEHIEQLSIKLMKHANRSLSDHLKVLIKYIQSDQQLSENDHETIDRLKEIINNSSKEQTLCISTKEFAQQIQSILTDDHQDDPEPYDLDKITVTGPNNIEYIQYEYVYLVRFTQQYYPEPIQINWPLNEEINHAILKYSTFFNGKSKDFLRKYYLNRSLFQLFTVLNSPTKKLIITYGKSYDGALQTPAHYLNDIAKVFGIEEDPQSKTTIEDLLKKYGLLNHLRFANTAQSSSRDERHDTGSINQGTTISLEELSIYDNCPQRFFYQKKYPNLVTYTNSFQIKKYAQACLYENAIPILIEKFPEIRKRFEKDILYSIDQILDQAKNEIKIIFPLGERYWEDILFDTNYSLKTLVKNIFSKIGNKKGVLKIIHQHKQIETDNFVFTGRRELQVKVQNKNYYYVISNFKDLLSFSTKQINNEHTKKTKKKYFEKIKMLFEKKDNNYFSNYAHKIHQSTFHKKVDNHCIFCPYIEICSERAIHQSETNG